MSIGAALITCVILIWLLFTSEGQKMLMFLLVVGGLALLIGLSSGCTPQPDYRCNFDRMQGAYTVTARQLEADSQIVLASRDGRDFAFPRRQLFNCWRAE